MLYKNRLPPISILHIYENDLATIGIGDNTLRIMLIGNCHAATTTATLVPHLVLIDIPNGVCFTTIY